MKLQITKLTRRFTKEPIKLYWFVSKNSNKPNFGDELSREVVEKVSGRKVQWADKNECELVAIGSILQVFTARKTGRNVTVWGSGFMFDINQEDLEYNSSITDIQMVRGRLSAQKLGLKNVACGDPGLLADKFYAPSEKHRSKIGFVPHYVDSSHPIINTIFKNKDIKVINVLGKPGAVVSKIASCDLIISSSLHGIIAAHSFGVPAYWVELSDKVAGNGFKFYDYYSAYNEEPKKLDIEKLNNLENYADDLISSYVPPQNIESIKTKMIKAFPSKFL